MTNISIAKTASKKIKKQDMVDLFILLTKMITHCENLPTRVKIYSLKYSNKEKTILSFKTILTFGKEQEGERRIYQNCSIEEDKLSVSTVKTIY